MIPLKFISIKSFLSCSESARVNQNYRAKKLNEWNFKDLCFSNDPKHQFHQHILQAAFVQATLLGIWCRVYFLCSPVELGLILLMKLKTLFMPNTMSKKKWLLKLIFFFFTSKLWDAAEWVFQHELGFSSNYIDISNQCNASISKNVLCTRRKVAINLQTLLFFWFYFCFNIATWKIPIIFTCINFPIASKLLCTYVNLIILLVAVA